MFWYLDCTGSALGCQHTARHHSAAARGAICGQALAFCREKGYNDESFQYELFKIAQTKGYYKPAQKATTTEVETVKTELQQ